MPIDNDDVEDVFNLAAAQIEEWISAGLSAFMNGPVDRQADTLWKNQPDEVKAAARERLPEAAATLDNLRKRL